MPRNRRAERLSEVHLQAISVSFRDAAQVVKSLSGFMLYNSGYVGSNIIHMGSFLPPLFIVLFVDICIIMRACLAALRTE
jgi:hypothetical protein